MCPRGRHWEEGTVVCEGPRGSWGSFTLSPPNPEVLQAPRVLTHLGSLSTSHPKLDDWKPWGLWTLQAGTLHTFLCHSPQPSTPPHLPRLRFGPHPGTPRSCPWASWPWSLTPPPCNPGQCDTSHPARPCSSPRRHVGADLVAGVTQLTSGSGLCRR